MINKTFKHNWKHNLIGVYNRDKVGNIYVLIYFIIYLFFFSFPTIFIYFSIILHDKLVQDFACG